MPTAPPARLGPLRRSASAGALAVLALGASAVPAAAQEGPGGAPADVALTVSGPTSGAPGGDGTFTVRLRNEGESAAPQLRITLQLSDGLSVSGAPAVDGWTCVGNPFSCDLDGALPPGATAPALPVRIAYSADAGGREEVSALAHQAAGARVDKATAVVVVERSEPEPAPTTPAPTTPAPTSPAPTTPAPVPSSAPPAPAPSTAAATTAAPAPVTTPAPAAAPQPAQEPVEAPAEEVDVVEPAPVASEEVPESLPFADDGTTDEAAEADEPEEVELAARPRSGGGVDGWLVGLFVTAFVAFGYCVVAAIAKSRRAQV